MADPLTSYMASTIASKTTIFILFMKVIGEEAIQTNKFWNLGLIKHNNREIKKDVTNRPKVGWLKKQNASGILCSKGEMLQEYYMINKYPLN